MDNQLISLDHITGFGKAFFESGLFTDVKSAAQAIVKIQAGQEIGIPPFAAMSGIHIIVGKPVIGAGLMASLVKRSGKYDYRVVKHDKTICSIDFYQGEKKIGNSEFTIADAQKAGTKNLDKFPSNMLFARAISNGVKFHCPDVFAGPVYVPEEMDVQDIPHEEIKPKQIEASKELKEKINANIAKSEHGGEKTTVVEVSVAAKKQLTDGAFLKALARIKNGEAGLLEKIKEQFELTPAQVKLFQPAEDAAPEEF